MDIAYGILCGLAAAAITTTILLTIVFVMPRFFDWVDLNLSKDYLENRAERKVRNLKMKIRVIELEKEAISLEKKLNVQGEK